jgi:hypothetical protein
MGSIRKILLTMALAAAAISVAAPAVASAHKLEYSNGEPVYEGAAFSLKSSNMRILGPAGYWTYCNAVTLPAEVIESTAESAEAEGAGPGTTEWCYYKNGRPLPTEVELIDIKFTGAETGTINLKISQDWGSGQICKREGSLPMTYTPGTSVVHVAGYFPGEWCLTERYMTGDFSLQSDYPFPGQPIIIK